MLMEVDKASQVAKKRVLARRMEWYAASAAAESPPAAAPLVGPPRVIADVDVVRIICARVNQRKLRFEEFRPLAVDPRAFASLWESMGIPESIALSPAWVAGMFINTLVIKNYSYATVLEALMCGFRCDARPSGDLAPAGLPYDWTVIGSALERDRPDLALLLVGTLSAERIVVLGIPAITFIYDVLKKKDERSQMYETLAPGITELLRLA